MFVNVDSLKKNFPVGTRVELIKMVEDPRPIPPHTKGVVDFVDDVGTIYCKWDNGMYLELICTLDTFVKI